MDTTAEKTEFQVKFVRIGEMTRHPNADKLSLVSVDGYPVVVRTEDYKTGDLAVYVPVDAIVPTTRPEFAFLKHEGKDTHRIRAAKLRGIFSMGLLVKPQGETFTEEEIANNVITSTDPPYSLPLHEYLGIEKYIPPEERALLSQGLTGGNRPKKKGPKLPVYGLDPLRKYGDVLQEGEEVVITEKIHGCNARYYHDGSRLWVGSHKTMRGSTRHRIVEFFSQMKIKLFNFLGIEHRAHLVGNVGDVWWEIAEQYKLKEKLSKKPGFVLYGEIYGEGVQAGFTYDSPKGRKFRAFDVYDLKNQRFLDYADFRVFVEEIGLQPTDIVPIVTFNNETCGPTIAAWTEGTKAAALTYANTGKSTLASHMCEGVVVKPAIERMDPRCGRVALKFAGSDYLLRKEG